MNERGGGVWRKMGGFGIIAKKGIRCVKEIGDESKGLGGAAEGGSVSRDGCRVRKVYGFVNNPFVLTPLLFITILIISMDKILFKNLNLKDSFFLPIFGKHTHMRMI